MIEFVQNYGVWIALVSVFAAMHWFGMGCCGSRDRRNPAHPGDDVASGNPKRGEGSEAAPKSRGSCH